MNIAKLNTASLDDKTFIINRGTSGGSTPINNQDKVVDITENGTTEVVADNGYTGLGKVTINTEVSGGESASTIEYLDMTNVASSETWMVTLLMVSLFVKQQMTLGGVTINAVFPTTLSQSFKGDLLGVNQFAVDFKAPIVMGRDGMEDTMTVADFLIQNGATQEKLDALPRITKEQFYSLD